MTIVWGEGPKGRSAQIVNTAVEDIAALIREETDPEKTEKLNALHGELKLLQKHLAKPITKKGK